MQLINKAQEGVLKIFGQVADSGQFYLTGGTALSYFYLHHRKSNDLDFFTSTEDVILPFSHQFESFLRSKGFECLRQRGLNSFVELNVTINKEKTLIHLALDTPFRFESTIEFPGYPKLRVDNLIDIASNKLLALFGRATLRDFIDIYFLVKKENFLKNQLIDMAKRKDPGFDLYWLGVAFERIHVFPPDAADMLLLIDLIDFKNLQEFFDEWRMEISKELKS